MPPQHSTLTPGRDVEMLAALALARSGETVRAKTIVGELEKSYPSETLLKVYWLPTIKAAIELNATNALRNPWYFSKQPRPMNWASPTISAGDSVSRLPSRASLPAGTMDTAAAAEFQKLSDHRGTVLNFVTGALAHLQLGRAYAMAGDTAKAKSAYKISSRSGKTPTPIFPS
jgi:hypothetical protein